MFKVLTGMKVLSILLLIWVTPAQAFTVVTTLPDFVWIAKELLGKDANVEALLSGHENPHYVDANPKAVLQVSKADVLCFVGLDLEVGYVPALISRSGNKKVHQGEAGYCDLSQGITVLGKEETPKDRSHGDVHPHGNPHYYLSPSSMVEATRYMATFLSGVSSLSKEQRDHIIKNRDRLTKMLTELKEELKGELASMGKLKIYEYHKEFLYFAKDYGLEIAGSLEEKPGLAPSAARIAVVAQRAKQQQVQLLLAASYTPESHLRKFKELSGLPVLQVPTVMTKESRSYFDHQRSLVKLIKQSLTKKSKEP